MTPSLTYDFNDYQVLIYKEDDHVSIYAYDKQISTNFSKSFTNDDAMNLNMTLDIFYNIMVKVFETSYYKKEGKTILAIATHNNTIKLDIRHGHLIYMPKGYKFYSEIMFEVFLDKRYKF
jgi:Golgi nucleoside diphosphatase